MLCVLILSVDVARRRATPRGGNSTQGGRGWGRGREIEPEIEERVAPPPAPPWRNSRNDVYDDADEQEEEEDDVTDSDDEEDDPNVYVAPRGHYGHWVCYQGVITG